MLIVSLGETVKLIDLLGQDAIEHRGASGRRESSYNRAF